MKTIRVVLDDAQKNKKAIGHFNISDSSQLNAIARAAKELAMPVIIGVSDGEAAFVGLHTARALVDVARTEYDIDIFLNRDHAHTVDDCKAAIDSGFDSVIFDGVKLPLVENIAKTKEVIAYARAAGRDVIVEAELGYIGTSSALLNDVPDDVMLDTLPTADDARMFVNETRVDALAPAVGNLHGMLKGRKNPVLAITRIAEIRAALPSIHLVLHGGSGLPDEEFTKAIAAGMNCVHINTEIRVAYRNGIENALKKDAEQIAPYKYLGAGQQELSRVVRERMMLFWP